MSTRLLIIGLLTVLLVSHHSLSAQQDDFLSEISPREDFSDLEIFSFIKANEKVLNIQMESEEMMLKAIENEGLTAERFNEILEQQRDPIDASGITREELRAFNLAAETILRENAKIEKEMNISIEDEGLDVATYKQIMIAYQQRPDFQERVHRLVTRLAEFGN